MPRHTMKPADSVPGKKTRHKQPAAEKNRVPPQPRMVMIVDGGTGKRRMRRATP